MDDYYIEGLDGDDDYEFSDYRTAKTRANRESPAQRRIDQNAIYGAWEDASGTMHEFEDISIEYAKNIVRFCEGRFLEAPYEIRKRAQANPADEAKKMFGLP